MIWVGFLVCKKIFVQHHGVQNQKQNLYVTQNHIYFPCYSMQHFTYSNFFKGPKSYVCFVFSCLPWKIRYCSIAIWYRGNPILDSHVWIHQCLSHSNHNSSIRPTCIVTPKTIIAQFEIIGCSSACLSPRCNALQQ